MERHFGLPIAFAAALHGALLFGPSKTSRPAPVEEPAAPPREFVVVRMEEELPRPPDDAEASAAPKLVPDAPVLPRSDEPPPIAVERTFPIARPPVVAVDTSGIAKIIDVPTGIDGGTGKNPWGPSVLSSTLLDNSPRARLQAAPMYPYQAKRDGITGEVLVEFMVDETGAVRDPQVVRSSDRVFEEASLRAVAKWRFEPGRRNGKIVRFRMAVPVVFNLNE